MAKLSTKRPRAVQAGLAGLRNVGRAALADFRLLGIATVDQLAVQDPDRLYVLLCQATSQRHDPCVHDVFAATIHEARTGEKRDWWHFTTVRKARQSAGTFPDLSAAPIRDR